MNHEILAIIGLLSLGLGVAHAGQDEPPAKVSHSAKITISTPSNKEESSRGKAEFWPANGAGGDLYFRLGGSGLVTPALFFVGTEAFEVSNTTFGDLFTGHFSPPSTFAEQFTDVAVRWGQLKTLLRQIAATKKPAFAAEVTKCLDEMQYLEAECATPDTCQLVWPWQVTPKDDEIVPFLLGRDSRIEITCGTGDPFSWGRMYVTLETDKVRDPERVPTAISAEDTETFRKWVGARVVPAGQAPQAGPRIVPAD